MKARAPIVTDPATLRGWAPLDTAPIDGTEVRVGHALDPGSLKPDEKFFITTGLFRDGRWICSAAFVCADGLLRFHPTHWLPGASGGEAA